MILVLERFSLIQRGMNCEAGTFRGSLCLDLVKSILFDSFLCTNLKMNKFVSYWFLMPLDFCQDRC